jgi:hypothetical protein
MLCKCAVCGYQKAITEDYTKWPYIPGFRPELYPVTRNGRPDGQLQGFICARCLKSANSMRVFIRTIMTGAQVTDHAVSRYIERSAKDISDFQAGRMAVLKAFSKARKIRFKDDYMFRRVMNNNCNEAEYYWNSDLVFVTTRKEPKTILSVEKLWGKSLNKDFFLSDDQEGEPLP